MTKNCSTCISGEGECGKRNMCIISDAVGQGNGDGNWYTKWRPKNSKFPCGNYCWELHRGNKTCDECAADYKQEYTAVQTELDERIKMLDGQIIRTDDEVKAIVDDRKSQVEKGTKYDSGKPRIGEMVQDFMKPLLQVCKVWEFGAKEYSKSNWKKVENGADRYTNAMIRHFIAEDTEVIDKQTGLHHAVAVAWNALARLYFIIKDGE